MAVPPVARRLDAARLASARVASLAMAIVPFEGYTGHDWLVPATTANAVPSCSTSIAAATADLAEAIFVCGTSIDPEQSTMMISAAGVSLSAEVTVTTASTVRPPSGKYWFWSMSTVNPDSLMYLTPQRERNEYHGDVVHASGLQRKLHQLAGHAERVRQSRRHRALGEAAGFGQVVPQAVGAQQHRAGTGRGEREDVCLRLRDVRAEPPGDHVRLPHGHRGGLVEQAGADHLLGQGIVGGEPLGIAGGQPVGAAVSEPADGDGLGGDDR